MLLISNPLSGTKKFFQKTIGSLRSYFSKGSYQKLPKSPPPVRSHFPYTALEDIMNTPPSDYMALEYWDDYSKINHAVPAATAKRTKKITPTTPTRKQGGDDRQEFQKNGSLKKLAAIPPTPNKKALSSSRKEDHEYSSSRNNNNNSSTKESSREEGRSWLVAQKLRELEMLDVSNVDHMLDIEEVLHYYSRLTCPAYLDIVDKFFLQIYSEFFHSNPFTPSPTTTKFSRLRPRSLMRS